MSTRLIYPVRNIAGNQLSWLAYSDDLGETWKGFDPENYVGDFNGPGQARGIGRVAPGFA